jgi:hypothetical protein
VSLVDLEVLYPRIASQTRGLNQTSAIEELAAAARVFCRETLFWRQTVSTSSNANDPLLIVDPIGNDAEPVGVFWVQYGSQKLWPRTEADMNRAAPAWRDSMAATPRYFIHPGDDELILYPTPLVVETKVLIRAAYQPKPGVLRVGERVMRHYDEALVDGALHRILRMPNSPWSNPGAAEEARIRFEGAISRARVEARHQEGPILEPIRRFA